MSRRTYRSDKDTMPEILANASIRTKEDLLRTIRAQGTRLTNDVNEMGPHTTRFVSVLKYLVSEFTKAVEEAVLPHYLEDWWRYSFEFSYKGARLKLEHISSVEIETRSNAIEAYIVDAIYLLVFTQTSMLTVDEYAKLYEVEPVTVRQWIRRCKIRTVEKAGKEWRISSLTDIPRRGFEPTQYIWYQQLEDLPLGFEDLNDYKLCTITQKKEDRNCYQVRFSEAAGINSKTKTCELNEKEHEALEAFFIGNPDVTCAGTSWSYWMKKGSEIVKEDNE